MKGMKRFAAMLLAVVILAASVPAMKTEAAGGLAIKGKFITWGMRKVTVYGQTVDTYDCAVSYIGIDRKYNATAFQYQVFTQDGSRLLRQSKEIPKSDRQRVGISEDEQYWTVKVEGGRRTVLTSARVRARINGKWSAWSGLIGLIPLHTPDYIKISYLTQNNKSIAISWSRFTGMSDYEVYVSTTGTGGWKMVTRTTGTSYTLRNLNGRALGNNTTYYLKVIGRAKVGNTMTRAKGDSASWVAMVF